MVAFSRPIRSRTCCQVATFEASGVPCQSLGTGVVTSVEVEPFDGTLWNLTVEGAHTFFVSPGAWLVHNGCNEFARALQKKIGGEIKTFAPRRRGTVIPADAYKLGPNEPWAYHTVVEKDGKVFDEFTPAGGMPIGEWKQQWGDFADELDFGF